MEQHSIIKLIMSANIYKYLYYMGQVESYFLLVLSLIEFGSCQVLPAYRLGTNFSVFRTLWVLGLWIGNFGPRVSRIENNTFH